MLKILQIFVALSLLASGVANAGSSDFDIRLARGSEREQAAASQLRRLLDTYDVSPYVVTYSVMIDEYAAPHSHPVLTLNAVYLEDDASALSIFLHEQMHWFELLFGAQLDAALEDLKILYPDMPENGRGGGRNAQETFNHLIVGSQEFRATASLFGREEAKRVIEGKTWYRWIYREVIENEAAILAILKKHSLTMQDN